MRYFIEFSYNGKNYHGWQSQPNANSVQETLEKAMSTILRTPIALIGAGRTDSGVHAKQMFAHFDINEPLDMYFCNRLNAFLPKDIAIHQLHKVKDDAHARFDAVKRTYQYYISTVKDAFAYEYSMYLNSPLDIKAMNTAAQVLFKYIDFQCFSKTHTDVKTYLCKIYETHWERVDSQLVFTISADRFLRNMVRAVVGTLIEIGLHKLSFADFEEIIHSRNRSNAGASVPACGLFLTQVEYPEEIFLKKVS